MATLQAATNWLDKNLLTAKRATTLLVNWAEDHISECIEGDGESTYPASGSTPLEHTVVWTHGGVTFTSVVRTYGSQQELDDAVAAIKDAIAANGGSVVSG